MSLGERYMGRDQNDSANVRRGIAVGRALRSAREGDNSREDAGNRKTKYELNDPSSRANAEMVAYGEKAGIGPFGRIEATGKSGRAYRRELQSVPGRGRAARRVCCGSQNCRMSEVVLAGR